MAPAARLEGNRRAIARSAVPRCVADESKALGVIYLKDVVKEGSTNASSACAPWVYAPS